MPTLTKPITEAAPHFVMCGPPLEVGAEKDPARSFTTGVEFELRFRPYAQRIFRSALIVAQNPAHAQALEREICQKAWRSYFPMPATDFARWLSHLLQQGFTEYLARTQRYASA